jgi:hypothetical protein
VKQNKFINLLCAGQAELDFEDRKGREEEETKRVVGNMDAVLINGTQLLLNGIYDGIGFNCIADEILRHLVIARVSQPASKLATTAYLKSYYSLFNGKQYEGYTMIPMIDDFKQRFSLGKDFIVAVSSPGNRSTNAVTINSLK